MAQPVNALNGVDLVVHRGEMFGILGPNGAGKTTLINILSGLLTPDGGRVQVLGEDICLNGRGLRQRLNLCSGNPNFPWSMTVRENLRFYAMLYGVRGTQRDHRVQESLERFGLVTVADRQYDSLSTGTKQRLALAKALLNRPDLLFLDEPTMGLDPDIAQRIRQFVLTVHRERQLTIVVTTHYMKEAEQLCGRIAFLKAGRLHALGTADGLKQMAGVSTLDEAFLALAGEGGDAGVSHGDVRCAGVASRDSPTIQPLGPPSPVSTLLGRIQAFAYRNWIFAKRNVFAVVEMLFWPTVGLLSIGLMGDFLHLGAGTLGFVLTGAIVGGALQVTQLDVSYSLMYDIWSKSLKHSFLAPVGIAEYILGPWLIGIVRGTIVFVLLTGFSLWAFRFQLAPIRPTVVLLMGIFLNALLVGGGACILVLLFGQRAEYSAWALAPLVMLLCGVYYPPELLPRLFYAAAQGIPLTYFLEFFRGFYGFSPVHRYLLLKGFSLCAVYLLCEWWGMRWALRQARASGILLRLSE